MLAVPGEITSALSAGTNALLRLGATPATCAADVLEAIGVEAGDARAGRPATSRRRRSSTRSRPARRRRTSSCGRPALPAREVAAALVELELAGAVTIEEGVVRSTIAR